MIKLSALHYKLVDNLIPDHEFVIKFYNVAAVAKITGRSR